MTVARSLIVSSTPYETRAALLEGGVVAELFFERDRQSGVAGNIYRGRVRKILPGMQSAFVDVGLEKDAFLYVSDVIDPNRPATDGVSDAEAGAEEAAPVEVPIEKRLTEGQEIDVQVAKEPMAGKGARVTTHISLPGRYLVYMPTVKHLGVSRRIENEEERSRLKEIMEEIRTDEDGGFIVRTASEGVERDELEADAIGLRELSALVSESMKAATAPALVHSELGLLDKLLRDRVVVDFDEIIVDTVADRDVCLEFLRRRQSDLKAEVRLHSEPEALFEHYGLEREIDKALRSKVWLKSGGYLVINQTEALVSIDVNTGRFVGKVNLEETARSTNLEAARESARQIRLRSLGGIIVIDFIDMEKESNREELTAELEEQLKHDRAKTRILKISDFGLVEMTRKRVRGSLERLLCQPCDQCGGSGTVRSAETMAHEISRDLIRSKETIQGSGRVTLRVNPMVADILKSGDLDLADHLREAFGVKLVTEADPNRHIESYDWNLD